MDCTFCLDCIHACPHDNVGILAVAARERRCGTIPFARVSAGSASALTWRPSSWCWLSAPSSMPRAWSPQSWSGEIELASLLRQRSPLLVTSLFYVFGPRDTACADGRDSGGALPLVRAARGVKAGGGHPLSYALVPLGFSMWLAHYSFHFLASFGAVTPALQRFAGDLGWAILGRAGMGTRLLPARRGLASPAGNPVPRSGVATLAVFGLSDRSDSIPTGITSPEDAGALGVADGPPVRGRSLDCSPTHADAWHPVSGRMSMRPMIGGVSFGWLLLGTWCAPASADGGSLRLSGNEGRLSDHRLYRTHTVPSRRCRCQRAGAGCLDRRPHAARRG